MVFPPGAAGSLHLPHVSSHSVGTFALLRWLSDESVVTLRSLSWCGCRTD